MLLGRRNLQLAWVFVQIRSGRFSLDFSSWFSAPMIRRCSAIPTLRKETFDRALDLGTAKRLDLASDRPAARPAKVLIIIGNWSPSFFKAGKGSRFGFAALE